MQQASDFTVICYFCYNRLQVSSDLLALCQQVSGFIDIFFFCCNNCNRFYRDLLISLATVIVFCYFCANTHNGSSWSVSSKTLCILFYRDLLLLWKQGSDFNLVCYSVTTYFFVIFYFSANKHQISPLSSFPSVTTHIRFHRCMFLLWQCINTYPTSPWSDPASVTTGIIFHSNMFLL